MTRFADAEFCSWLNSLSRSVTPIRILRINQDIHFRLLKRVKRLWCGIDYFLTIRRLKSTLVCSLCVIKCYGRVKWEKCNISIKVYINCDIYCLSAQLPKRFVGSNSRLIYNDTSKNMKNVHCCCEQIVTIRDSHCVGWRMYNIFILLIGLFIKIPYYNRCNTVEGFLWKQYVHQCRYYRSQLRTFKNNTIWFSKSQWRLRRSVFRHCYTCIRR